MVGKVAERAPMMTPAYITALVLGIVVVWQTVAMYLWLTFPAWDWVMLRISLSFADAIALAALALSLYSYAELYALKAEYGTFDTDEIRERREKQLAKEMASLNALEANGGDVDGR